MARSSDSTGRHGPGKWLTAVITTGAALAALLVNAKNLGMDQWLGLADYRARRVWVTPRADTLLAIGDTTLLAATVTDERGATLTSATLRWQSTDSSIATVDSTGTVIAREQGSALVTASVREFTSSARIVVRQVPVRVTIPGDSVTEMLEGDTMRYVAQAFDARDHLIRDLVPRWRSDDTAVVAVDSLGRATGVAPGTASLTAAHGEYAARIVVRVALAPAAIVLVSGGDQRMPAGQPLPRPVVVRILSRGGTPVPDVPVIFVPADGEGEIEPDTVTTGRDGQARARWMLGDRPGRHQLLVSTPTLDSALVVMTEGDPVLRNTRVIPADSAVTGTVGAPLAEPVLVRVTDSAGAALVDVPVTWTALDRGTVAPIGERTDSLGEARARWTLGPRAGAQRLRVQVGNPRTIPPVTLVSAASPGTPTGIMTASGQGQTGTVGTPLARPVVVAMRDTFGNAVPAVPLVVRAAKGTVTDTAPTTDSTGRVKVRWTMGRVVGTDTLTVRASGLDSIITVTARSRPGTAANVAFTDPPTTGTAGARIRLTAVVTDAYGNTIPNTIVVFTARAGVLSASRVASDDAGLAVTRWTPGPTAGDQAVTATLRGTTVKATHTVRIAAPAKK
jgi:hypothetical protein